MLNQIKSYIKISKKSIREKIPLKEVVSEVVKGILGGENRSVSGLSLVWILRKWLVMTAGFLLYITFLAISCRILPSIDVQFRYMLPVLSFICTAVVGVLWATWYTRQIKRENNIFSKIDRGDHIKEVYCACAFFLFGAIMGINTISCSWRYQFPFTFGCFVVLCVIAFPWIRAQMNKERSGLYFFPMLSKIGAKHIKGVNYPCTSRTQEELYIERELLMLIRGDLGAKKNIILFESEEHRYPDFLSGIGRFLIGSDQVVRAVPCRHLEPFLNQEEYQGNHPQVRLWSLEETDVLCIDFRLKEAVVSTETEELSAFFKGLCQNERFLNCIRHKTVIMAMKGVDMERYLTKIREMIGAELKNVLALKIG